jgi:lipoprotein-releasing system permease protein
MVGIGLGAFALLITLSTLNGFESEISRRVIDLESHLRVTGSQLTQKTVTDITVLLENQQVREVNPFIVHKSILTTENSDAVVRIKAIGLKTLHSMLGRPDNILRGSCSFESPMSTLPGILLGFRLADKMGLYIGDTLEVVNPLKVGSAYSVPYVGKTVVTGIFRLDLFDYDENLAFIELDVGQRLFEMPALYSGVDIKFDKYIRINATRELLKSGLGPEYKVSSWEDLHKTMFAAMKLEKYGSFVALSFIILVAIFNLTSSLVMLVMEKIKEIGMLQALGMNQHHIQGIFLRLGVIIGSFGLIIGLGIALILSLLQIRFQLIPLPPVYFIPYLPMEVHLLDILAVLGAGIVLIYIGTLYPSWKVGKLMPLEAIQYEK